MPARHGKCPLPTFLPIRLPRRFIVRRDVDRPLRILYLFSRRVINTPRTKCQERTNVNVQISRDDVSSTMPGNMRPDLIADAYGKAVPDYVVVAARGLPISLGW